MCVCHASIKMDDSSIFLYFFFFFQAEDGIRDLTVTGVQTCALPISARAAQAGRLTVRQARPMTAARAYQIRIGSVVRSGHGPLAGRRAAELEQGAGHRDVASTHPKLHLPWRERHNGVPGAPPKPTSRRRLQPGPL